MTRRFSLVACGSLLLALSGDHPAAAQPSGTRLSPEVEAILGTPEGPRTTLDADVVAFLGPAEGSPRNEPETGALASELAGKLRCPVCQGVSIADSPSGMATAMRAQVRELAAHGYSREQIFTYFERSYGELVRLEPPLRGVNVLLWVAPAIVLLAGAVFLFVRARPQTAAPAAADKPASRDPELDAYLAKVRRDAGTPS